MPEILVTNRRYPLLGLSREEALEKIRAALRGRVLQAYVYGSFARDELCPNSDIDCILVTQTDAPFPVRGRAFEDLRDILPSLEMLVYTPDEFARLTTDPSPGFWTSVTRDLTRIL
jgi:predicted nucleotidyltransferase